MKSSWSGSTLQHLVTRQPRVDKAAGGMSKDEIVRRVGQFGDLIFHVHQMGGLSRRHSHWRVLGRQRHPGACGSLRPATVTSVAVSHVPVSASLGETDLRILRCLLKSGARTEVPEIAKQLCISEKTVTRRLEKMKEDPLLDFSLQCSPAATAGYVHFCILIIAEKLRFRASMSACTQNFSTTS